MRMLEELRANREAASSVNMQDAQGMEIVLHQQPLRNNNGFMPLSVGHNSTSSLDQLETGRR